MYYISKIKNLANISATRAIIRPTTERSPGTFNDCAFYGIPYSVQF